MINLKIKLSKAFYILFCVAFLSSCTSDSDFNKGKKQLEAQGYTNVKNTGYRPFYCGEDDTFSTGFTAIDSKGNKVDGC
ncbi:hypothetical protein [Tenacibaculum finnmarkense]|nr:hypothetical protein [Tenacibaculum finnmarkense]MCG8734628.1 hypothetical protein [Tenacibaculum finnmarkense]